MVATPYESRHMYECVTSNLCHERHMNAARHTHTHSLSLTHTHTRHHLCCTHVCGCHVCSTT